MLPVNVARYHTTNRTASSNGPIRGLPTKVGLRGWNYGNGTLIGNSPITTNEINKIWRVFALPIAPLPQ